MDESVLLDLLECPVCLERLDASAKVLPCQHTFCRRCLQGILGSRGELRCPECRTLVECAVDELPSNILLVRLLDGIKQRPRKAGPGAGVCTNGTSGAVARSHSTGSREQGPSGTQPQRAQAKSTLVRVSLDLNRLPCGFISSWEKNAVYRFLLQRYLIKIPVHLPCLRSCKALYDFELKDKEADKDCLPFSKDDILTVIRRVDENWAEGMLGDKIGIFPISYVEFNTAARQLIELDKPSDSNGDSGEGASSGPLSNGAQRVGEKKNSKKRHSFTSLTMSHKPMLAPPPQRHSMEISGPVLISSSNPTAAARIGEISGGLSCSAPSQGASAYLYPANVSQQPLHFCLLSYFCLTFLATPCKQKVHICTTGLIVTPPPSSPVTTATVFTFPSESSYSSIPADALPPPPPPPPQSSADGAAYSLAAGQRPSPSISDQSGRQRPTVYVAMFPYTPRKEDELELRKGEMFLVLERCQDGWFKGTSMHTGKIGVFPGNYMSPVSRTPPGSSQAKVHLNPCTPAGRGITIVSPSSATVAPCPEFQKALTCCSSSVSVISQPAAVVTAPQMATGQQPKVPVHVNSQMTVNQARNAVRTAVCHGQDRPTAAVTPILSAATVTYLPHLAVCSQPPSSPAQSCTRVGVAMGCAAASLTPPNVSAASLEGDALRTAGPANSSASNSSAPACRLDKDTKKEKKSLLKLLSNKKKSRSSPPSSPTLDAEQAAAAEALQGAVAPDTFPPSSSVSCLEPEPAVVVASASSSSSSSSAAESSHRRSSPLDACAPLLLLLASPAPPSCLSTRMRGPLYVKERGRAGAEGGRHCVCAPEERGRLVQRHAAEERQDRAVPRQLRGHHLTRWTATPEPGNSASPQKPNG
ncbi:unnamed protein product [Tetraodon nigroviridis]|uniref:E3 ubiquitin-protein ligase SH3RF1 n=1 Tax=Tetraodon nigroviridis TaxID=99883 RepID=Q4RKT7_TETNG|nr:unnamed protein product [Tetraodon nigroviridis]